MRVQDKEGMGMQQVGIIYGDVGTSKFNCILHGLIQKTEYVQMQHELCGWVLGQVDDIKRETDLSSEKAQLLVRGQQLDTGEEVSIKEKILGTISVVGYRDERNLLQVPHTPFKAGEAVYKADEELIKRVVGLEESPKVGAYIGMLNGHNIKVFVDINAMVQKHVSILAKTGGGKSYLTGVLVEELIKHGVTSLILDPHAEYSSLREAGRIPQMGRDFDIEPKAYSDRIIEYSPDTKINPGTLPLKFTLSNLDARDLLTLTTLKNVRTYLPPLKKAIDTLKLNKPNYTVQDLIETLETEEEGVSGALVSELNYLRDIEIFAEKGTHISELVKQGKTTIINLRGSPPDIQELITNRIATALFELRKVNKVPPVMLVVEEAHNFCPQQGIAASSKVLRTIASEGRKFGLGLCIITQRAAKVDKNVLSQCNTQFILKVTNPNDLKAIAASVEGLTAGMMDEIQSLPVGIAITIGGSISMPLFVEIRPRETRHGGESVTILPR